MKLWQIGARLICAFCASLMVLAGLVGLGLVLDNLAYGSIRPFSWPIFFQVNHDAFATILAGVLGVLVLLLLWQTRARK